MTVGTVKMEEKMNSNRLMRIRKVMIVAFLAAATMFGSGLVPAKAADYGDNYGVRWDKDRERRYAFLLGYHTGYSEGRDTRYHRVSYRDMPGYREGTNGWRDWMGDVNTYRGSYRRGYEDGFKDGQTGRTRRYDRDDVEAVLGADLKQVYDDPYDDDRRRRGHTIGRGRGNDRPVDYDRRDGYGRYDRNQIVRIAQQNGYNEGFRHGLEDRQRRRGYDFDDSGRYRDASAGYRLEYGNRETYRQAFREGYRRGYDDGYRRGARNFPF
jgi:hypothetical protein